MKKRRIGVTQRVEVVAAYAERRDCLDQRWSELLAVLDMWCVPLANLSGTTLAKEYLSDLALDGFILSGGNTPGCVADAAGSAPERDAFEMTLLSVAHANHLPVLGVCRGMQMIQWYSNGTLVPVTGHTAVRHPVVQHHPHLWRDLVEVNSYHNYGIAASTLPDALEPLAWSGEGLIEAFRHRDLPWYGIMWHPEREAVVHPEDAACIANLFRERP